MSILSILKNAVDEITRSFKVVEYAHHEVHEGHIFQSSYKSPEGSDVADNASVDFLIVTGARTPHFVYAGAAGGDVEIFFYENTTTSDDGTPLTANGMNRNTSMTPTTQVYIGPTVSNVGVRLQHSLLPGGVGPLAGGSHVRDGTEWNLKTNTKYLLRGTNRSGGAIPMSAILEWYEKE